MLATERCCRRRYRALLDQGNDPRDHAPLGGAEWARCPVAHVRLMIGPEAERSNLDHAVDAGTIERCPGADPPRDARGGGALNIGLHVKQREANGRQSSSDMDRVARFAETAAMTTQPEVVEEPPSIPSTAVFPWWVGLILMLPALLQMHFVPDYSAQNLGRIVGSSVVPVAATLIAFVWKSRRGVILTAVIAVGMVLMGDMMKLRRIAQLRGTLEDDCSRLQTAAQETLQRFKSAGGLLAKGLDTPEKLQQRRSQALAVSQRLTSLIERRRREGLIQTLVQGGIPEHLAHREADSDELYLVLKPRMLEATRDWSSAAARLLDVLSRESRWQVPEGGRVDHCNFLPGADPELVAEGERALAEISAAAAREEEAHRLFMAATMRADESGH